MLSALAKLKKAISLFICELDRILCYLYCRFNKLPKPRQRPRLVYCAQYYKSTSSVRAKEIADCLAYNTSLPWIEQSILFCEKEFPPASLNIKSNNMVLLAQRASFSTILKWLATSFRGETVVFILSNSDIFLDSSLCALWGSIRANDFICLSRYEKRDDRLPFMINRLMSGAESASQDTWIFSSHIFESIELDLMPDLPLGRPGCENALAAFMYRQGLSLSNPCINVKTFHNHQSMHRTYTDRDWIGGEYAYLKIQAVEQFILGRRLAPRLFSRFDD